jgi:hypothetical protein
MYNPPLRGGGIFFLLFPPLRGGKNGYRLSPPFGREVFLLVKEYRIRNFSGQEMLRRVPLFMLY